jgi:hypothetical protein
MFNESLSYVFPMKYSRHMYYKLLQILTIGSCNFTPLLSHFLTAVSAPYVPGMCCEHKATNKYNVHPENLMVKPT